MIGIAVGFDFDHTLGVDNKLERTVGVELLAQAAREAGRHFDAEPARRAMETALERYRTRAASLEDALREPLADLVDDGVSHEAAFLRFRAEVLARAPAFVEPTAGARALLEHLDQAGIPYALLTNGWTPLQEEKARLIGFHETVFVSDCIGAWKPSIDAFRVLVKHFALPPERIYYVGDDPIADVEGAGRAGLRSVWCDWEHRAYPDDQEPPAHRIRRLEELPALLAERQGREGATPKRLA